MVAMQRLQATLHRKMCMDDGAKMNTQDHRVIATIAAAAAIAACLWLLFFAGPGLINAHRDDAALLAALIYLGVPTGLAWGGVRLWSVFSAKEDDNG